jgi:hypothetical protein
LTLLHRSRTFYAHARWLITNLLAFSLVRFLDLVKPFTPLIPEVQVPETKVPFQQRIVWTSVTLVIFLVMSQMPLYGIVSSGEQRSRGGTKEPWGLTWDQIPPTRCTGCV